MKIGIDVRPLLAGNRSGVEEYALGLVRELVALSNEHEFVLFSSGVRVDFDVEKEIPGVLYRHIPVPNKVLNFSFRFFSFPKIDSLLSDIDLFFMPNILFSSVSGSVEQVITLHDISYKHFPEFLSLKRRMWHLAVNPSRLLRASDAVTVVSESTKEDVVRTYQVDEKRVFATGSAPVFKKPTGDDLLRVKQRYGLPEKFVLCLGTLEPRKNIYAALSAFSRFHKEHPEYTLVIAGKEGWKVSEVFGDSFDFLQDLPILFTGFVAEEDKYALFSLADIFLYLSFFEGFGLPLLEAASVGTPVIAGAHSSVLEVVGDAAFLIDPCNVEDIFRGMHTIASSSDVRERYVRRGYERSEKYSLKNVAQRTLDVFNSL